MSIATAFHARQNHPALAYHSVHIESQVQGSATPHRLISMLFDGAMQSLMQAKGAIQSRDIQAKTRAIDKAVNIIDSGLRASLDLDAGGRIASDLHALYGYVLSRVTFANLKNDVGVIDECIQLLQPIRDAWRAIEPGRPVAN